jgi:hypothetical protein
MPEFSDTKFVSTIFSAISPGCVGEFSAMKYYFFVGLYLMNKRFALFQGGYMEELLFISL